MWADLKLLMVDGDEEESQKIWDDATFAARDTARRVPSGLEGFLRTQQKATVSLEVGT